MNKSKSGVTAAVASMIAAALSPFGASDVVNNRQAPAYPEEALEGHPGANPNRGRFGSRGYTRATFTETNAQGYQRKRLTVVDASRWLPHIGAKQRAKGLARAQRAA